MTRASESQAHVKPEIVVGIDLGTTNSLVSIVRDGKPVVLNVRTGQRFLPSVVSFAQGEPVIGHEARRNKVRDARHTVFSVKRLLGRGLEDLQDLGTDLPYKLVGGEGGVVRIEIDGKSYSAVEISAMILRELKLGAESALGASVTKAVITVPAYFNDSQRQATRAAGRIAGLEVLRIINEPTAASLAYGLDRKREGLIAVYDLGGGTFDVSILKLHDGIFEVLSTHGDTRLGGDDLDLEIAKVAANELQARFGIDAFADARIHAALLETAEAVKIALSERDDAVFKLTLPQGTYERRWKRGEFEALARPILERTRGPCERALQDAGLQASQLSDVVMVGGPTRLPVVQAVAREIFGRELNTSMHPDEVVAQGAAIQADILSGGNRDLLLLDVVPLSLGIETYGGVMSPLIARNTKIPTAAREMFTTFMDNQTAVDVHVLQGERERVEDNRSLARFKVRIQPAPAGIPRVEVIFLIDADGILQVSAKDLKTGNEQSIEVKPSYGLTEAEVERILESRQGKEEEDTRFRALVEARNQAAPILMAAEKKLPDAQRLLSQDEAREIERKAKELRDALAGEDIERIGTAGFALDQATARLAGLLVDDAIRAQAAKQKA